jgi:polyhydroxyalkanoate synthase
VKAGQETKATPTGAGTGKTEEKKETAFKRLMNLASLVKRPKPPVGTSPVDVVHAENKWRLLRYRRPEGAPQKYETPILLVPSLINRHYVMDLLPGKSMAEDLVQAGHDVYCIDWGTPGREDRFLTFDDICDRYLGRAIRQTTKSAGVAKTHVLGYCLGGTLSTIHAARHPEHIASLLLLAAPVRFSDDGLLARWTQSPKFDVEKIVAACGNVPWQLMQGAFHMLRPTLSLAKAVHLIDRAENDEFLNGFLALETWGNDNVSFPGAAFEQYIDQLYRKDLLVKGQFSLGGKPVHLEDIACPTLSVVFEHDNIVPWQSAAVLIDMVSSTDKAVWKLPGGHVGAVVSKSAQKKLWPSLSAWWAQREGGRSVIEAQAEVVSEATAEKKPAIALRVAEAEGDGHGANGAKRAKKKAEVAR